MIRTIIGNRLDAEEHALGASLDYVRDMLHTSLGAFFKFAMFLPLSRHRKALPRTAYHVARIVATRDADCGTCVQIEVNLARSDDVPSDMIRSVLDEDVEALPDDLADVYRFAVAVVTAGGDEGALRERLRYRYGDDGLVELALAMASARVFPIVKRTLGYAKSCAAVQVEV